MKFHYAGIGARKSPADHLRTMRDLGADLANMGLILRSGGAAGADSAFEEGCASVGGKREIFLPWEGFRGKYSTFDFLEAQERSESRARGIAKQFHPIWDSLTETGRMFHTRNVFQVLGASLDTPSKFIACWTEKGADTGGTGQALRIARFYGVPIFNLALVDAGSIIEFAKSLYEPTNENDKAVPE